MLLALVLTACSTKKNTRATRFWHSFTARYNIYYNGHEAYKSGCEEKEKGNQDNYTERIPLFIVGNEKSRALGKANFETAITKCEKAIQLHSIKRRPTVAASKKRSPKMKAYLSRKEFNPFLKNAWLLMGQAQYQKGEFLEAASTFSYIARQYAAEPLVATEARIWLARCYVQESWFYDAEDALARASRDSLTHRLHREFDASQADLLLGQGRLEEALPYLRRTARAASTKLQKARLYFLLGQIETSLGHKEEAYKAYARCLRQSPPYEMAFNARIRQTEVMASTGSAQKVLKRLRSMARSANNAEYLDQVYYAMGNVYLTQADTTKAIAAYEKGRARSKRNGIDKGVLLLRLGGVYWQQGRYDLAQSCYGDAIGLIDKTYPGYADITRRSKILDELAPHTSAVHLQDSLLHLSVCPEKERNEAIDRTIAALRQREEAEKRAKADSVAESRRAGGGGGAAGASGAASTAQKSNTSSKDWYFYNVMMVTQGKQDFAKRWGRRKNEDNWRRSNKTVLANVENEEYDYAAEDSLNALDEQQQTDSVAPEASDSAATDPHTREYYLAQIPFSDEAKQAAHAIIQDGLYNAGIIEKDKLEDFPLAARTLQRLETQYPQFEKMEDVYYHLFLLYSRWKRPDDAARYRQLLAQQYPTSALSLLVNDPEFEYNARYGKAIEDSLYTDTYAAYCSHDAARVQRNFERSSRQFPTGANRPKFIFVHALSRIGAVPDDTVATELRNLVKAFPESDVSEMAGMLAKGIESGRRLQAGGYDVGSLWARRTASANAAVDEAGRTKQLSDARDVPFVCIVAYPTDSLPDGQVLYDLAHFNFTGFRVRNFDIQQLRDEAITQLRVAGFNSYDEAHAYAQQLFADSLLAHHLTHARIVLISSDNLELLGTTYSFDDYQVFFDKTFAPMQLNPQLPLDLQEAAPAEQHYEDEYTPEELEEQQNGGTGTEEEDDDGGEWYTP